MQRKKIFDIISSTDFAHDQLKEAVNELLIDTERQQNIADIMRQMASRLAGELDFEPLLVHITEEVSALGYAGACVFLKEQDENGERQMAGHTSNIQGLENIKEYRLSEMLPLVARILDGHTVRLKPPFESQIKTERLKLFYHDARITDSLSLPISYMGTVLGSLVIMATADCWGQSINSAAACSYNSDLVQDNSDPFSETAVQVLTTFADHAAVALSSAILHRDLRAAHSRLEEEKQSVQAQAEELIRKNEELTGVQQLLEAQYCTIEAANAQLASLATTDGMTKLGNHRAFQEELSRELARVERSQTSLSLILLDVDKFKQFNDEFGHPAGDEVLKTVASLLKISVREGDFPARYGGEEFAVVLPDTELETAAIIAERIRNTVEKHPFANRQITVSIGVTQHSSYETGAQLVQRADVALYEAKTNGRNCVQLLPAPIPISSKSNAVFMTEHSNVIHLSPKEVQEPQVISQEKNDCALNVNFEAEGHKLEEPGWSNSTLELEMQLERQARDGGLEGMLQEPMALILSEIMGALDRRGGEEAGHSHRLVRYMLRLGEEVSNLYEEQRTFRPLLPRLNASDYNSYAYGALLHDIGKIGISTAILLKRGKLNEEEWRQIRRHPLSGVELISGFPILSRAVEIVRSHHERWDGDGYPQGLSGTAIPLGARIFALCDTFDVLMHGKQNRNAKVYSAVCKEISAGAGTQFDPEIVTAFLRIPQAEWIRLGGYTMDRTDVEIPEVPQSRRKAA